MRWCCFCWASCAASAAASKAFVSAPLCSFTFASQKFQPKGHARHVTYAWECLSSDFVACVSQCTAQLRSRSEWCLPELLAVRLELWRVRDASKGVGPALTVLPAGCWLLPANSETTHRSGNSQASTKAHSPALDAEPMAAAWQWHDKIQER